MESINYAIRQLAILPIRFYRYCVDPLMKSCCRFFPSCSSYAQEAIMSHGVLRGGFMTLKRLIRCHPFCEGGIDYVPPVYHPRLAPSFKLSESALPQGGPVNDEKIQ